MSRGAGVADIEQLYRCHADELRAYLYRRAGQAGADLLQEVFVVALRRRDDLPAADLRRAWLFGVARRLLLAAHRAADRDQAAEREHAALVEGSAGVVADREDDRAAVVRAVLDSFLTEKDRELIRLTEWEGLRVSEAALVLGLRASAARVRLHRARQKLAGDPTLRELVDPPPARLRR